MGKRRSKRPTSRDDILQVVFLFSRPHSESSELFKRGPAVFRQTAVTTLEDLPASEAERLVAQIGNSVLSHLNGTAGVLQRILHTA